MLPATPPAAQRLHDARCSRYVPAVWLVGVLGLAVIAPAAVRAAVPPPPALDMERIRQLAQPQAAATPGPGMASPRPTAPAAAPASATGGAATARPAIGAAPVDVPGAIGPNDATEDVGAAKATRAPAVPLRAPAAGPAPAGKTPRSTLDVALIRQLAQPQATPAPMPASPPAEVAVPDASAPKGVPDQADEPREPVISGVTANPSPGPAQPIVTSEASAPSSMPTAPRADRSAGDRAPLDRRVIASLATGEMDARREGGGSQTDAATGAPALPQTQLDLIKGVFAPETQD